MRFRIGPPPEADAISREDSGWRLVGEPKPLNLQIMAVFVAACIALGICAIASLFVGLEHVIGLSWPAVFLFILLIMPIHELLHAAGFEGGLMSRRVVFGVHPQSLGFYAHYDGPISRHRYIIVAALPFLVLTALPLGFVAGFRLDHDSLTELIIASGLVSSLDVLTIGIILKETPGRSLLVNSGMKTYWRLVADNTSEQVLP
jgi:hypothetical protein